MKVFWTDRSTHFPRTRDPARRRRLIYRAIDRAGFQWLVVLVAGVGFFTDAYVLFASNVVLPAMAYVYWTNESDVGRDTAINSVTLAGCIFGQIFFGIMADIYGRRKMYGIELIIIGGATLGVAMCSNGVDGSMDVIGWLLFWRLIGGIGVGADYPLSAVITSEFAPRRHRPRMLAAVFFMQPIGQLAATVVSIIAISAVDRDRFESDKAAVDSVWRWVIGVGAIPAAIALLFRLTIPESPRYRLDVQNDSVRAQQDTEDYFGPIPDVSRANTLMTRTSTLRTAEAEPVNQARKADESSYQALKRDLHQYFVVEGNWRYLAGTAGSWFLLDWSFYGLGLNNPATVARILNIDPNNAASAPVWQVESDATKTIYQLLLDIGTNALIVVSIGAVMGGAGLIFAIAHFNRKMIQLWGFIALAALFVIIGATFPTVNPDSFHGVTTTLFIICQIFFNFGPNAVTFIIPAEVFPTRYRCTCHGISAAAGKLGSVLVQVFVSYAKFGTQSVGKSRRLGYVLLVFAGFMVAGALVTWFYVPDVQDPRTGENLSLEELADGRRRLKHQAHDNDAADETDVAMRERD